jgi:hypothetical protein
VDVVARDGKVIVSNWTASKQKCRLVSTEELKRAGIKASYGYPTIFHVRDNLVLLMINHEYGIKAYDAAQVTEATMRARTEVFRVANGLRKRHGSNSGRFG